jgi:hypothetical protein
MNKNKDGEADAKGRAEKGPVHAHEGEETEEKLEFEDGEKKSLAFCEDDGDGSERAELASPTVFFFRRWSGLRGEFEFVGLAANPLGLRGAWRKKREGFEPLFASLKKLVLFLKSFGSRRDANEFLAVDKGVAWITGKRPERQACAAIVTVANGLEVRRGHDPSDAAA